MRIATRPSIVLSGAALLLACAAGGRLLAASDAQQPAAALQSTDVFEARVRPVLLTVCGDCHTDDEKGGLRIDSRAALLKGGEHGPAIVPGDADKSLLMRAVRQEPGVVKMPKGGTKLSDADIAALAAWIQAGAPWPEAKPGATAAAPPTPVSADKPLTPEQRAWWSFQPLAHPPVPDLRDSSWAKTDIDRFVLARLQREGLAPVATADRRTLIRRATLDVTGLPATPEEIDAFLADASPDAWATVVDRLLASPRYGEAWGRHWLDVARYGEDDPRSLDPMRRGYNPYPNAYLYRDWVIKAFNDDLPYDQFVKAQLAADSMDENVRARMLPGLGFLGLGPWYYDNGSVEVTRADERHDRVDVVSRGFLGLTVACARCHDHKYDPISQRDYYALAGVFLNSAYHEYPLAPKSVVDEYKSLEKNKKNKEKLLEDFMDTETEQLSQALALQASTYMQAAWRVTGEPKEDAASVATKEKLDFELFQRWIRFLAKPPKFYPYLKPWQELITDGGTADRAKTLADDFQKLLVDVMFDAREIKEENDIIRAKALPGTKKKERANLPNEFVTNDDFCPGCGLELKSLQGDRVFLYADVFRSDVVDSADPANAKEEQKPGLLVFRDAALDRWLGADRLRYIDSLRADLKTSEKAMPPRFAYVHGVADLATPQTSRVALRGSPFKLADPVPSRMPIVLTDGTAVPFTKGSGRAELADAIVRQPLAMRVIVNRVWKWHFGTGLVNSASNFGRLGDRPANPELLEYLASWFADHGCSMKKLHREILLSAVYQLSTANSPEAFAKDSDNRLYWRANRRRMTAEEIRDSTLFVSGSLDGTPGGPSEELTPTSARRTVYGKVSRYRLDQYLQLFDFPAPTISAEQRFTTNVPLQRLFLMNSDFMQQQAEALARRIGDLPDNSARVTAAYRLLFGRAPDSRELQAGIEFLSAEPMRAYAERKAKQQDKTAAEAKTGKESKAPDAPVAMGDGMMAGVTAASASEKDAKKLLPVTPFGRYLKVLLSSSEFLFVE
jgi:cytochrome c553